MRELHQRCEAIVAFCRERFPSTEDRSFMSSFGALVQEAAGAGDLPGLKMLHKELERLAENLSPADHLELQALLSAKGGPDRESRRAEERQAMSDIFRRGAVRTMDEYVLLRGMIDHEAPEGRMSPEDESQALELLSRFEAAM